MSTKCFIYYNNNLQVDKSRRHPAVGLSGADVRSGILEIGSVNRQELADRGFVVRLVSDESEAFRVGGVEGLSLGLEPVDEDGQVGLELAEEGRGHPFHHREVVRLVDESCDSKPGMKIPFGNICHFETRDMNALFP